MLTTLCCSSECERKNECFNHSMNRTGTWTVENWYNFGSGSVSDSKNEICWWCGEHGNWGLFVPINNRPTEDCLVIGFDSAPNGDDTILTVARVKSGKTYIENMFKNEEALDMYNYLIGNKKLKRL